MRAKTDVGAGKGKGLASKMVLIIRWRSFFEYLITKESAKPETISRRTTGASTTVEVRARDAARAGVQ